MRLLPFCHIKRILPIERMAVLLWLCWRRGDGVLFDFEWIAQAAFRFWWAFSRGHGTTFVATLCSHCGFYCMLFLSQSNSTNSPNHMWPPTKCWRRFILRFSYCFYHFFDKPLILLHSLGFLSLSLFRFLFASPSSVLMLVCGLFICQRLYFTRSGSTHIFYWSLCLLRFSSLFYAPIFIGKHFYGALFSYTHIWNNNKNPSASGYTHYLSVECREKKKEEKVPMTAKHAPIHHISIVWSISNAINCR